MAKPKYTRINTPVGVTIYPHLTEPDTKFDADGSFHTKLALPVDEASDLVERLESIRDEFHTEWLTGGKDAKENKAREKFTLADVSEVELDDEGDETGRVILKFKMKHRVTVQATQKTFTQEPLIVDSANQKVPLEGLKLWGGSKVRLNADVVPYAMASSKTVGVSLRLRAVQIVELSSGGGGSPFDEYEGGETFDAGADQDDTPPFDADDSGADTDGGDY